MPNDEQGDKSNVNSATLNRRNVLLAGTTLAVSAIAANGPAQVAQAQQPATTPSSGRKPNIIFIVSDDFGYGDAGAYLGGEARGMPTPNLDRLAAEGMQFLSFYAQPSCTPGRAAMQTGRIPNRSGMTTVAFQGQGGGLPAAEWTLASVLKTAGYKTFFTGKWHLGEDNYALPNAQGYDEMKYCGLYHLNAYTYADPTWFPDMSPELRAMFARVTKGALSGNAGEAPHEDFKINGQYVNTPDKGVVGIPFFDEYVEKASLDYLDRNGKSAEPFFMNINFMKVHQPNMPAPEFEHKSMSKSKYADSVVENDTRIGRILDKVRALGLDKNTYVFWTTDNGAWQDVSRCRIHAVSRHQGHGPGGRQSCPVPRLGPQYQGGYQEFRHRGRPRLHGHLCGYCRRKAAG
jgi:arylsulfatase A-like enzyme